MKHYYPRDVAHRGYLIRQHVDGQQMVLKGGHLICWAPSVEAAKAAINELLDPEEPPEMEISAEEEAFNEQCEREAEKQGLLRDPFDELY